MNRKPLYAVMLITAISILGLLFAINTTSAQALSSAPDCIGAGTGAYDVPNDNPLIDGAGGDCDEIWSYGLRNPWRFSFDKTTGDMWIGDVGQNEWEEIDFQLASSTGGENYGWRCYEGNNPYDPRGCGPFGSYVPAAVEYDHSDGCSITGGYVYRGSAYPDLVGHYFATDYCTGYYWDVSPAGGGTWNVNRYTNIFSIPSGVTSFGEDNNGELYALVSGRIYRMQDSNPGNGIVNLSFSLLASGFSRPVALVGTDASDASMFLVEQAGRIRIVEPNGATLSTSFLDIQGRVDDSNNEEGLLGLAFDPNYDSNNYFYVNYTHSSGVSRVSRFEATANPNVADPNSEVILFTVNQPFGNHNGGDLHFGPDGYLYASFGDGGSGGDPQNHAQNTGDLLGTIVRIDPPTTPLAVGLNNTSTATAPTALILVMVGSGLLVGTIILRRQV